MDKQELFFWALENRGEREVIPPEEYQYPTAEQMGTEPPVIPIEHAEWEVLMISRTMFNEKIKEQPWIRHQQVEPTLKLHLCKPVEKEQEDGNKVPHCICGDKIPDVVVLKFYWMEGIYNGKRVGAKAVPKGVKVKI